MTSVLRCPICGKSFEPDESEAVPFCSERCRRVDLHRWFEERYGLEIERDQEPQDPEQNPPPP